MTQQIQRARKRAATDAPSIAPYTGVYTSTAQSPWGDVFSPLIIDGSGDFTLNGTTFLQSGYDDTKQAWFFGPQAITGKDRTFQLSGSVNFTTSAPPAITGSLTIGGVADPIPFPCQQIVELDEPTLASAADACGVLQTGDVITIGMANGAWLNTRSRGGVIYVFWGQIPADQATKFTVTENGFAITLATSQGPVTVTNGVLTVTPGAPPALFTPNASCTGGAMLLTSDGQYWLWDPTVDGGQVLIAPRTELTEAVQFAIAVTPVSFDELCRRYGITVDESISPCDLAVANFAWQLTGGLFLAVGLTPFMLGKSAARAVAKILQQDPVAWGAIKLGWKTICDNPVAAGTIGGQVLIDMYASGTLWAVIKFTLIAAGWFVLFVVVARILEWCLAPQFATVRMLVSMAVWMGGTLNAALLVQSSCPQAQAQVPAASLS